jgi:hypothetical protein
MSIAAASDFEMAPAPARPIVRPLLTAAACVALADWLFYGWPIGISLALFLAVLGIVAVVGNDVPATRRTQMMMTAAFVAGLLALVEDVSFLSVIVGTLTTAIFVIVMTARETSSWQRNLFEAATAPVRGPFQLARDVFGALRHMKLVAQFRFGQDYEYRRRQRETGANGIFGHGASTDISLTIRTHR